MPTAKPSAAGAMPKEMTSASESRSAPSGEDLKRQRAMRPSMASMKKATGISTKATHSQRCSWVARYCMAERMAPAPEKPLSNVTKSASTNVRIIEKWRRGGFSRVWFVILPEPSPGFQGRAKDFPHAPG